MSPMLSSVKRERPNGTSDRYWRENFRVNSAEKFRTELGTGASFKTQPNAANVQKSDS
jgi:hypothetical protein